MSRPSEAAIAAAFGGDRTGADPVHRLTVAVFDGVPLGSMSFAFGVFDIAGYYGGLPGLALRVVAGEPGTSITGGGLSVDVPYDLEAIRAVDLVIVPTLPQPTAEDPPESVLEALRAAHARGARMASVCNGTFVLAAAGLLDDRTATTHWAVADCLATMYPKVRVDASVLYIDDGDVLTAGGGAAGIDLGLHLIRAMAGACTANRLARAMVVPPHRPGGQAQFIESPMPDPGTEDPVAETMTWARTRLHTTLPVDDLESGDLPVDEVARRCGFSSAAALRPHFHRLVGVTRPRTAARSPTTTRRDRPKTTPPWRIPRSCRRPHSGNLNPKTGARTTPDKRGKDQ